MKRLLNTLYVTRQDAWLAKEGASIVVKADGAELGRSPIHMLGAVVCFSRIGMSPALMGSCAQEGVSITPLTEHGRFLARVEGSQSGNILLRRAQHRATKCGNFFTFMQFWRATAGPPWKVLASTRRWVFCIKTARAGQA